MPEAGHNTIDIWLVDDREVTDAGLLEQYRGLLDEEETGRHQRFIFNRHRHLFLVARALVRSVLARSLGIDDPAAVAFTRGADGKPALSPATGLQFNLSHTHGLVALAVTRDCPVGIDVEFLSRQADIASLAERYFAPAEAGALLALPVEEWNTRFFDLWTLKEAFLKACGTGLRTPLRDFSFTLSDADIDIVFAPGLDEKPHSWQFWQLDVDRGYRLALAVNGEAERDYHLVLRQGVPLQGFGEVAPAVVRRSLR